MAKILSDNLAYAKVVKLMGMCIFDGPVTLLTVA